MKKINFKNGESGDTPLSSNNLNLMQDNIDEGKIEKMAISKSLTTAGWYRVAKTKLQDVYATSLLLNINTLFENEGSVSVTLNVNTVYEKAKIETVNNKITGSSVISKARVVKENGCLYIEVYYAINLKNTVYIDIIEQQNNYTMLDFEAPTNTATVLDEITITPIEGTWTPEIQTQEGKAPTVTYTFREGKFKRYGSMVHVTFSIRGKITALNGTDNYAMIKGLPYQSRADRFGEQALSIGTIYDSLDYEDNNAFVIDSGHNSIRIQYNNGAGATKWKTTTKQYFQVCCSGWYETNE